MKNSRLRKRQQGVSLIEIMIALVILSVGVLALAKLQSSLMVSGRQADEQLLAVTLAERKLSDLRGYDNVGGFDYADILDNSGGGILSGSHVLGANNQAFTLSWDVERYPTVSGAPAPSADEDRVVTISVVGPSLSITRQGIFRESTPGDAIIALEQQVNGGYIRETPTNKKDDGGDDADIDFDDSTSKQTSVPKPVVINASDHVIVSFEVETFDANDNSLSREPFITIDCSCRYPALPNNPSDGAIVALNTTRGFFIGSETISGTTYTVGNTPITRSIEGVNTEGIEAAKVVGLSDTDSAFCDVCCRDHHDRLNTTYGGQTYDHVSFDPWRDPSDFYTSGLLEGDHKHYNYAIGGQLVEAGPGDPYTESCRFRQTANQLGVTTDWRAIALNVIPQFSFQSVSAQNAYSDYVRSVAKGYIDDILGNSSYPQKTSFAAPVYTSVSPSVVAASSIISSTEYYTFHGDTISNAISSLASESGANVTLSSALFPSSITVGINDTSQLTARAIYMEYMDRTNVRAVLSNSIANYSATIEANAPFYDVNVTGLVAWGQDPNINAALVTNESVDTTYSRGLVSGEGHGTEIVSAVLQLSNTGIVDNALALDGQFVSNQRTNSAAAVDSVALESPINVTISGASILPPIEKVTVIILCSGNACNAALDSNDIESIVSGNDFNCIYAAGSGNSPDAYTCSVSGGTGTIRIDSYNFSKANGDIIDYDFCVYSEATAGQFATDLITAGPPSETNASTVNEYTEFPVSGVSLSGSVVYVELQNDPGGTNGSLKCPSPASSPL